MPRQPKWRSTWKKFSELWPEAGTWITPGVTQPFPNYLAAATERYAPAMAKFKVLLKESASSEDLFERIHEIGDPELRISLIRIFRRYVSPSSPVELLKRRALKEANVQTFSTLFRPLPEVRAAFQSRPLPDQALAAVLWEHQERGKPGATLTEEFFAWVEKNLEGISIRGGRDINLQTIFPDYPKKRGVDFVMSDPDGKVVAVGFLHYDSDRGGAQEADRVGQYREAAEEIVQYLSRRGELAKLVFINDGPGLLAGAMWRRYGELEELFPYRIQVNTMRMLQSRLTMDWLYS